MTAFVKRLRAIRHQQGITQETLARRSKISHGFVARLEIGMHNPSMRTLVKLSRGLRVPPGRLIGGDND